MKINLWKKGGYWILLLHEQSARLCRLAWGKAVWANLPSARFHIRGRRPSGSSVPPHWHVWVCISFQRENSCSLHRSVTSWRCIVCLKSTGMSYELAGKWGCVTEQASKGYRLAWRSMRSQKQPGEKSSSNFCCSRSKLNAWGDHPEDKEIREQVPMGEKNGQRNWEHLAWRNRHRCYYGLRQQKSVMLLWAPHSVQRRAEWTVRSREFLVKGRGRTEIVHRTRCGKGTLKQMKRLLSA